MTQYNQQLIYDFEQSILHLNTQHKSSISQIKKELLPLWVLTQVWVDSKLVK